MEFISSYSFILIVIVVVLVFLLLIVSVPKNLLPAQCYFYNSFSCSESGYSIVPTGQGGLFYVLGLDSQPGILNISLFTVSIGNTGTLTGSCTPSRVAGGQQFYCYASSSTTPTLGGTYTAIFTIFANYCTPALVNSVILNCPASAAFSYAGFMSAQATKNIPTITTSISTTSTTSTSTTSTSTTSITSTTSTSTTTSTTGSAPTTATTTCINHCAPVP